MSHSLTIHLFSNNKPVHFVRNDTSLAITDDAHTKLDVPLRRVLWVDLVGSVITVHVLTRKHGHLALAKATGSIKGNNVEEAKAIAEKWVEDTLAAAYQGVKTQRRFLVVVNPLGGPGKAPSIFKDKVKPIFKAAHCTYDVISTEYHGHALKIGSEVVLDNYDAVVAVSGDGTLHELINGFAQHKEPMRAFKLPIAPVPAGSGNGTSLNLLGVEEGQDIAVAALNAIKGRPMALDVASILQNGKRSFSFMSQCVGLMADLDLGTEHLRWMGSNRFVYGYLRGILTRKGYPFSISVKAVHEDKRSMVEAVRKHRSSPLEGQPQAVETTSTELPPLQYVEESEGWTTLEGPILYLYAGKGPFVSRDLMQFPVSMPNDGTFDVVIQSRLSRMEMLRGLDGAENGSAYWRDSSRYFKVKAYRLKPVSDDENPKGHLSIDGERFPFGEYYAEVHHGLATMLSMTGRYEVEFNLEPPSSG
ncbi:ATP-NAD kinase-like domain-containing protein [Gloeopeniophorella convolvens]|nr:ATP-NAD kinase-like domain-containing protein [Gloeopeniophorella convolvens]